MQRRYYFKILISLVVLSTAPVVLISTFLYNRFTDRFMGYLANTNQMALQQVNRSIELVIADIDTMAQVYNLDMDIEYFSNNHFLEDPYRFNNLQRKLFNLYHVNELLDSVYVIFNKYDYLIYAGSNFSKRNMDLTPPVEGFYRFSEMEGNTWFSPYTKNTAKGRGCMLFSVDGENYISFVMPLTDDLMDTVGVLVFNIRERDLYHVVEGLSPNLNIVYGDTVLLRKPAGSPTNEEMHRVIQSDLLERLDRNPYNTTESVVLDGHKYIITQTISRTDSSWRFFSYMPTAEYLGEISFIRNVTIIGGLVIMVVCIVLAFVVGRQIYTPIGKMANRIISSGIGTEVEEREDEIQLIGDALTDMVNIKRNMDRYLRGNLDVFRNTFLLNLVRGHVRDFSDIGERISFFGLDLPYPTFYVLLMEIDGTPLLIEPAASEYDRATWKMQIITAANRLALDSGLKACTFEALSFSFCILVNISESDGDDHDTVSRFTERLKSMISETLPFTVSIGISHPAAGFHEIHRAYESATSALERRFIVGRNCILYADFDRHASVRISGPNADESALANSVVVGDEDGIRGRVMEFFSILHDLPPEQSAYAKNAVGLFLGGVLGRIRALDADTNSLLMKEDLWATLEGAGTLDDAREWLTELLIRLCRRITEKRTQNGANAKVLMVEQYIHENYHRNISLTDMAEYVSLNPAYLSKLFKDETGKNISDYLNQLRIQESKQLLRDPTRTITEVSTAIGYNNNQSFSRFFKKFEGFPPDEYRKKLISSKSGISSLANPVKDSESKGISYGKTTERVGTDMKIDS